MVVQDNNIEKALRLLKKQVGREGIFKDIKRHMFFEKPSERKVRERKSVMRRRAKEARKKRARENAEQSLERRLI